MTVRHGQTASTTPAPARALLDAARAARPFLDGVIRESGDLPLVDYRRRAAAPGPWTAVGDLARVAGRLAADLYGPAVGGRTAAALEACPAVLTANHHGVDWFAQSVQGNLICALTAPSLPVLPVFAFANVALNNVTYPRGLLVYDPTALAQDGQPRRYPLFGSRERRRPVITTPAYTSGQVDALETRLRAQRPHPRLERTARRLLDDLYRQPALLAQPDYLHQSARLNRLIWQRLTAGLRPAVPDLVCLAMEAVVAGLLAADLQRSDSLAHRCCFDPALSSRLGAALETIPGCWGGAEGNAGGGGTFFFWGVDPRGRRIPLARQGTPGGNWRLSGRADDGREVCLPWRPSALIEALGEGRLVPSLYTCFLETAFARGLVCLGGYYQGDYLPRMQTGTSTALEAVADRETACRVAAVPTDRYLSGMLGVMCRHENGLYPAGPVEILAGGGLTGNDGERLAALTVGQTHLAGLCDTVIDVLPPRDRPPGWAGNLARACAAELNDVVVVKEL